MAPVRKKAAVQPSPLGIELNPQELLKAGVLELYHQVTIDQIKDDKLRTVCAKYCSHLPRMREKGLGLFLQGPHGTGKTLVAALIAKAAIAASYQVAFTSLNGIVTMFAASWRSDIAKQSFEERIRESDFLVVDDLGKEWRNTSRLSEVIFDQIIRYRVMRQRPTILTTNESTQVIRGSYGDAVASLLKAGCIRVETGVLDYRTQVAQDNMQWWAGLNV